MEGIIPITYQSPTDGSKGVRTHAVPPGHPPVCKGGEKTTTSILKNGKRSREAESSEKTQAVIDLFTEIDTEDRQARVAIFRAFVGVDAISKTNGHLRDAFLEDSLRQTAVELEDYSHQCLQRVKRLAVEWSEVVDGSELQGKTALTPREVRNLAQIVEERLRTLRNRVQDYRKQVSGWSGEERLPVFLDLLEDLVEGEALVLRAPLPTIHESQAEHTPDVQEGPRASMVEQSSQTPADRNASTT